MSNISSPLSPEEIEARKKENEKATKEAITLATQHQLSDIENGQRPVVAEVQDSIKQQLEEKFGDNENAAI